MKLKWLWRGSKGYFLKMLISFLLVILVPVGIMGVVWYRMVRSQEREYAIRTQMERMDVITEELERRISAVEYDVALFLHNKAFMSYATNDEDMDLRWIQKEVASLVKKNEILNSIYLYNSERNRLFSSASTSYDFDKFYDTEWYTQAENRIQMRRLPYRYSLNKDLYQRIKGTNMELVYPCTTLLTIVTQKVLSTYIVANIDVDFLGEYINRIYGSDSQNQMGIVTDNGKVLYSNTYGGMKLPDSWQDTLETGTGHWQSKDDIFFLKKMDYESLYYVESYPMSVFYTVYSSYGLYILGICVGLVIFLIILANMLSRKLYQPIEELYAEIRETELLDDVNVNDELESLQRAFNEMSRHYKSAVLEERNYQEFMRMSALRMMLSGIFSQEKFFEENRHIFKDKTDLGCQLLLFDLSGCRQLQEEYENFCYRLKSVINSYLQVVQKGVFTELQDTRFTALYTAGDIIEAEYIQDFLIKAVNQLTEQKNYFVVSRMFGQEGSVREEYDICRSVLENAIFFERSKEELLVGIPLEVQELWYDKTVKYETYIIRCILNADFDGLDETLRELYQELNRENHIEYTLNMCSRILVTLDKEFGFYKLLGKDVQQECRSQPNISQTMYYMRDIFVNTARILQKNVSNENRYCREAKAYLEANYMRDLNITDVADYLGISYAYLSKIFKSQLGGGGGNGKLSEYLNIIRIEKGKEYLLTTNMSLAEIAEKVGYNNAQSFQRFFKKYENMTPGEYRKAGYISGMVPPSDK